MITDSVSDGYSFGSRVVFVYGVFFAATSLFIEYPTVDRFDYSLKYMMPSQICVTRIRIHFNRSMSN